jgi:hypothetical protein
MSETSPFNPQPYEIDVLRQLRGLEVDEYDRVLILISSFNRHLDTPPSKRVASP